MSIEGLLGFAPLPVPPHVFSLAEDRLTYARFGREPEGCAVEEHRAVELPPELFQEGLLGGTLRELKVFDAALQELLRQAGGEVAEACLVLPDAWMRVAFAGVGTLPAGHEARDEVLRWKLRRLVPFRVDELRIGAVEVTPLPGAQPEDEPQRLLIAFALEALLAQLEDAFGRAGVQVGQISNSSLSLLAALGAADGQGFLGLLLVGPEDYTSVFARGGEPVLHRYKGSAGAVAPSARAGFVERDLRLTRNFLDEHFPGERLDRVLLAAPPEVEPHWLEWLAAGLGEPAEALSPQHLPLSAAAGPAPVPWWELAPMLGAALQEVA